MPFKFLAFGYIVFRWKLQADWWQFVDLMDSLETSAESGTVSANEFYCVAFTVALAIANPSEPFLLLL
jgi:hypothetical protein